MGLATNILKYTCIHLYTHILTQTHMHVYMQLSKHIHKNMHKIQVTEKKNSIATRHFPADVCQFYTRIDEDSSDVL